MEKYLDKSIYKIVKQGVGGPDILLYGEHMDLFVPLQRAANQSLRNCGKHLTGGGFNPNGIDEVRRVYRDDH